MNIIKSFLQIIGIFTVLAIVGGYLLIRNGDALIGPPKPVLPIEITFREALIGDGAVAQFRNTGDSILSVAATFTNPTLSRKRVYNMIIDPGTTKEVGHLEGWPVASGDVIETESEGFAPSRITLK